MALDIRLSDWCCSVSMVWVQKKNIWQLKHLILTLFGLIFKCIYIPFAHSRSDSKFIRFYIFFIRVISLTTDKMVLGLTRIIERTTNLSIFSHNLWIFEQCKKSEDNCIANRLFTSCYKIKSLKQVVGEISVNFIELCMKGDYFARLTGK